MDMNNRETELFLDTYRRLETAAERVVGGGGRGSSVLRLAHLSEFSRFREELDYCRQVRNLLTHEAKINGEYGVYPTRSLQNVLETVLNLLENPPKVSDCMTPVSQLLRGRWDDKVLDVMHQMQEKGFSYIPLLQSGVVKGVFSFGALFRYILDGNPPIDETTTLDCLADYLALDGRKGLVFVSPDMPLRRAWEMFHKAYPQNKRPKFLLVTKDAKSNRPLVGVVTPYDLLKEDLYAYSYS
jgi:predicted transcriptional regulator